MSIKSKFSPLGYLFPKTPQVQLTINCNISVDNIYLNGVSIAQNTDTVTIDVNQGLVCNIIIEKQDYSTQYIKQFIVYENKSIEVTLIPALEDTLYLTINSGNDGTFIIPFNQYRRVAYDWKIDWGDGTGWHIYSGVGAYNTGITYNNYTPNTNYIIKIQNNSENKAWLNAFGFDATIDGVGPSSLFNKNKLLLIDGSLNNDMFFDDDNDPISYLFAYMFIDCRNLKFGDDFNFPQNMPKTSDYMFLRTFQNCISLDDLKNLTITLLTDEVKYQFCYAMFMGCSSLNDLSNFNLPQNITKCGEYFCTAMFRDCTSLESLNDLNLPPNLIDIANCPFTCMFYNCTSLNDLSNFNFPQNIINAPAISFAYCMFAFCSSLETLGIMKMPNIKYINNNIILSYKTTFSRTYTLPAGTFGYFQETFNGCTSLKTGVISFLNNWSNVNQTLVDYYFQTYWTFWSANYYKQYYYVMLGTFYNCSSLQETLTQSIKVLSFAPTEDRNTFAGCPEQCISTLNANWK